METESTLAEDAAVAQEKFAPYLEATEEFGFSLRPISGQMLRLGNRLELDIAAVGSVTEDAAGQPDEEYYDDLMQAVWLLSDDIATVACAAENPEKVDSISLAWRLKHLTSVKAEAAAMRAFVARWTEHRLEMAIVFGDEEASAETGESEE